MNKRHYVDITGPLTQDLADLPDLPAANEAYYQFLIDQGYEVEVSEVTIGPAVPIGGEPPIDPPSDQWMDFWDGPGSTNETNPRIERIFRPPPGMYQRVTASVDVRFSDYDAENRWQDVLAVSRGKGSRWVNLDLVGHVAVRKNDIKGRAGVGTKMGPPDAKNAAGEFIHKSKRIEDFVPRLGSSYRFLFEFAPKAIDIFGYTKTGNSPELAASWDMAPHNLPSDMQALEIREGHTIIVHLGAEPTEDGVEGITTATFSNLEIRMEKAA